MRDTETTAPVKPAACGRDLDPDAIRRPGILLRAARAGLADFDRARDLRRLLRLGREERNGSVLDLLARVEADLEMRRRKGCGTYAVTRHVGIMTALLAEILISQAPGGTREDGHGDGRRRAELRLLDGGVVAEPPATRRPTSSVAIRLVA